MHEKATKITIDHSSGGMQGSENPLIKTMSLPKTINQKHRVRKDINNYNYEVDMSKKISERQSKFTLPSISRQEKKCQEEENFVDPLIQQLISNTDDDPILEFAGDKRRLAIKETAEKSVNLPGNFKINTKADISTVHTPPPMPSSVVEEEGFIGKRSRRGREKRQSHANLKEDSECEYNEFD